MTRELPLPLVCGGWNFPTLRILGLSVGGVGPDLETQGSGPGSQTLCVGNQVRSLRV